MEKKPFEKATRLSSLITRSGIRYTVYITFTAIAVFAVALTGIILYLRFSTQLDSTLLNESQMLVEQVNQSLSAHLRNTIRLSNSVTYNVVKNQDISQSDIASQLQLLYNTHSDYAESIVLFSDEGEMLSTAPPATRKKDVDVTKAVWFRRALGEAENLHFSTPYVQNLFVDSQNKYTWIVSLSCAAEITRDKSTQQGVLLVDIKYSSIAELFDNITLPNEGYVYLIDAEGNIIYHPQHQLIASGILNENNIAAAQLRDGSHTMTFNGASQSVIVRSVGYTGWRIIGVVPQRGLTLDSQQNVLFVIMIFCLFFELVIIINGYLSSKLTDPIKKLELSVQEVEQGTSADVYVGGSYEIEHLGRSISRMVRQLRRLTDDIVEEHEQKQKSERNALQAQINPHFLYNTLDIIIWMIEKKQPEEAVRIVSALAKFFRLSLSGSKNIITVQDELEQVRNYLLIQEMRYKNKFTYHIDAEPETLQLSVIKLVLQPIVENSIYHGMEFMDGDGEITITARLENGDLYLVVQVNGLGMPPETVEALLVQPAKAHVNTKGSGIGLWNVNERVKLYFGGAYGLRIQSEPDEGTAVTLHLPAIPFGEMEDK
ncbi:MAG: sensor histidine kinase [Eubacteriales bacterium]|nr:sensor histidine kinase [Eubacteriales bacterium]